MKTLILFLIVVGINSVAVAQDGGDIIYVKISDLKESHVAKYAHLDFGNRSFMSVRIDGRQEFERVKLEVKGQSITFIEHRVDDGLNNWWHQQFLEAEDLFNGKTLRISKFLILEVSKDEIKVRAYFQYFDQEDRATGGPWMTEDMSLKKNKLVEVLFRH
ncbi:MAG TPA: hypothetical protein VMM38_10390 [Aridibacter sp.]|nr:hypothetical protein [Aridibacter sp.]